jgi:hypothetical protein
MGVIEKSGDEPGMIDTKANKKTAPKGGLIVWRRWSFRALTTK